MSMIILMHVLKPLKEMKKKLMSCFINCDNMEGNMCSLILIAWKRQETHQIRLQSQYLGLGVVDDKLYCRNEIPKHWDLQIEKLLLGSTVHAYRYNWNRNDFHAQYAYLLEFGIQPSKLFKQFFFCQLACIIKTQNKRRESFLEVICFDYGIINYSCAFMFASRVSFFRCNLKKKRPQKKKHNK
ncbi:hypothetical protein RFI_21930 [Reticulomyxa filosa]|uniref:Uncharacterized protein n=1 Tax=Reticulomyxa filosa TaxID=46433 RepID=X6MQT4_RETFI|nr:hypothetical protein RFI_21930 [Reticulomyxa filosa]|eukprot:ETO15435.1 hypothetical protein RFI_21930 [Reticulomyxa filosa]